MKKFAVSFFAPAAFSKAFAGIFFLNGTSPNDTSYDVNKVWQGDDMLGRPAVGVVLLWGVCGMCGLLFRIFATVLFFAAAAAPVFSNEKPAGLMVRISKIEVRMEDLEEYNALLKEEILASVKLEPGVLTLYAVCDKDAPNRITILEIYKDEAAYKRHIESPHFQKYKRGTLKMVKSLELKDVSALIPEMKIK